jgi:hypothetical protein
MPSGDIHDQAVNYPIQATLPLGKSGDGFNEFRAPNRWAYSEMTINDGAAHAIIAAFGAPVRAIRIYKYHLALAGNVAGAWVDVLLRLGAQNVMHYYAQPPFAADFALGHFVADFGPVGIRALVNTAFTAQRTLAASPTILAINVQYSTEAWGNAALIDGSEIT